MDNLYVLARQVLLDALEALQDHFEALVLVGAQAIYLQLGESDLAIAPYTTDGDIIINPELLGEIPPIEQVLASAKFEPASAQSVGIWIARHPTQEDPARKVAVDLLVPRSFSSGKGRRAARLTGHHQNAARLVEGLEGAIVDNEKMIISALEDGDDRSFKIRVAGLGALLIAKAFKIDDRKEQSRQSDKDALDVLRILRGTETKNLCRSLQLLLQDDRTIKSVEKGLVLIKNQFCSKKSIGVEMAIRATGLLSDPDEIANSCILLTEDLFNGLYFDPWTP